MPDKPYVIVVHGTWNPPQAGQRRWYQLAEDDPKNFCTQLNDRLEQLGHGRPVWRRLEGQTVDFHWTGANNHDARIDAGRKLYRLIQSIVTADCTARIHLVAHSHGGNVVLKAIQHYLDDLQSLGDFAPDWPELDESSWNALLNYSNWGVSPTWEQAASVIERLAGGISRVAFMADWITNPSINRLGRVVFLGTPFYWKVWRRRGRVIQGLRRLLDVCLNIVVLSTFLYLFAPFSHVMFHFQQVLGRAQGGPIPLNPLMWTWWGWTFFLLIVLPLAWWAKPRFPRDGNIYFDEEWLSGVDLTKASAPARAAVDALVVEAGPLDEALLALSSEPLVYGALVPQVRDLLRVRTGWSPAAPPIGIHHDIDDPLRLRKTLNRALLLVRRIAVWLCAPVLWPARRLLEAYLTMTLTQLISATASGLRPLEFKGARVVVQNTPQVRLIREQRWNVARLLLSERPAAPATAAGSPDSSASAADRYAFLWDADLLAQKRGKNEIWQHLASSLPHMRLRYGFGRTGADDAAWTRHVADLELVSVTLEERLKELAGVVELAHSQYYSNPQLIGAIAQFIATGNAPAQPA